MRRIGAVALAVVLGTSARMQAACALNEPEIVSLSGTIIPIQSYGAPGDGEDPERSR